MKKALKYLVIHCTATPEGRDVSSADIRRMHTAPKSRLYHAVPVEVGREVAVADDFHIGVLGVEVAHIFCHRAFSRPTSTGTA